MYVVTYLTVNGNYEVPCRTKQEAEEYADLVKSYKAAGVKIKELA